MPSEPDGVTKYFTKCSGNSQKVSAERGVGAERTKGVSESCQILPPFDPTISTTLLSQPRFASGVQGGGTRCANRRRGPSNCGSNDGSRHQTDRRDGGRRVRGR